MTIPGMVCISSLCLVVLSWHCSTYITDCLYKCCGFGSGIRCLFYPWIWDPESVADPDPGSGAFFNPWIWDPESGVRWENLIGSLIDWRISDWWNLRYQDKNQCCGSVCGIRCFRLQDPECEKNRIQIRDPGWTSQIIFPWAYKQFLD
jgi:hypothetical protein